MKHDHNWKVPEFIYSSWKDISLEYLQLVFSQAEKFLVEIDKVGENITEKAFRILGFSVTTLTISLGYLLADSKTIAEGLGDMAVITASLSALPILLLIKPIWGYSTYTIGSEPKMLMNSEEALTKFKKSKTQVKNLLFSECVNYQERISYVLEVNTKRVLFVDLATVSLLLIPLILIGIWCFRSIPS